MWHFMVLHQELGKKHILRTFQPEKADYEKKSGQNHASVSITHMHKNKHCVSLLFISAVNTCIAVDDVHKGMHQSFAEL